MTPDWKPLHGTSGRYACSRHGHIAAVDAEGRLTLIDAERGADGLRRVRIRRNGRLERLRVRDLVAAAWLSGIFGDDDLGVIQSGCSVELRANVKDPADVAAAGMLRIVREINGHLIEVRTPQAEQQWADWDRMVVEAKDAPDPDSPKTKIPE